jgi:NADPH:quinone reductase-like Zn-dependent oxidoreductase
MHPNGSHLKEIKALVEDDKIKPIIDKVYPFSESIEAFIHLASGRAKGKIVIKIA